MRAVFHVAAEFHDEFGLPIFSIKPHQVDQTLDNVPEEIRQDILFDDLLKDGSIEFVESPERQKSLENDPHSDITPEGKAERKPGRPSRSKPSPDADTQSDPQPDQP